MSANLQAAPDTGDLEYVGFWPRVGAAMIDTVLLLVVCAPLVTLVYGRAYWTSDAFLQGPADFLINWLLPAMRSTSPLFFRKKLPGNNSWNRNSL